MRDDTQLAGLRGRTGAGGVLGGPGPGDAPLTRRPVTVRICAPVAAEFIPVARCACGAAFLPRAAEAQCQGCEPADDTRSRIRMLDRHARRIRNQIAAARLLRGTA